MPRREDHCIENTLCLALHGSWLNSKVFSFSANNNQRIIKIKKIPLGKKWKCSYKMKNKTFKANINIPCHLRFKSRYFQNFEYQDNFVRTSEEYMWYDHRVTALPHR